VPVQKTDPLGKAKFKPLEDACSSCHTRFFLDEKKAAKK
jgi:cytochrome c556